VRDLQASLLIMLDAGGAEMYSQRAIPDLTSSVSGLLADLAHVRQARSRWPRSCPRVAVITLGRPPHRARCGHDLLIRRNGHIVQDCLLRSLCWADIPEQSMRGRCCSPSWQQVWQQSRVYPLMVFKSMRDLMPATASTCAFGRSAFLRHPRSSRVYSAATSVRLCANG
jgi:hypothetical protein